MEPLPEGEERCRVPYKWTISGFGLNLAAFEPDARGFSTEDGVRCPATYMDTLLIEGVDQQKDDREENMSTAVGDTVLMGDTPP